jgi:hypothetical protein
MKLGALLGVLLFAALPATTNYKLNSYGFGSGGITNASTATYAIEGTTGETSGKTGATTNTTTKPGYIETQQANVPKIASIDTNGGLYYNKLHFVLDTQNNPTDATYLVAVSNDGFVSDIKYLLPDGTLTPTLSLGSYQTYAALGSGSGSLVIGLQPSTTYTFKAKATQGKFSESAFGPTNALQTAAPSITFSLATSTQASPPFSIGLGALIGGTITTSGQTINPSVSTNAVSGANIYIRSQNGGLLSSSTGTIISAITSDLSGVSKGFGAQSSTATSSSGGPFVAVSPYNGSGNNVGIIDATTRSLYTSAGPVTNGAGTLTLKAKPSVTDPAGNDYQDVLTFIAAGNF